MTSGSPEGSASPSSGAAHHHLAPAPGTRTANTATGEAADAAVLPASASAPNPTAATDAAAAAKSLGEDTHVVGFEGSRDQVIVVDKKMMMTLWLFGNDATAAIDRAYEAFMLTPIFVVCGTISTTALAVALVHGVENKRWYWLCVVGGVLQSLVSLPRRLCVCCMPRVFLASAPQSLSRSPHLAPHPTDPSRTC